MSRGMILLLLSLSLAVASAAGAAAPSFIAFESGPVRPLALGNNQLFAANTPDNRLEIFSVGAQGLSHVGSVPVGMEPVAVALRSSSEVWVVNHLSDSVSIVDVPSRRVVRTLLVGDEPRDIVITNGRAFITTAHRGQQRTDPSIAGVTGAGDPQLTTPSVGRADVWVFDVNDPGSAFGGTPEKIVTLFGDTPRALAVSPDGNTVYAAVFHSGNQTAVVNGAVVCDGFGSQTCNGDGVRSPNGLPGGRLPGGSPGPSTNLAGDQAPEVGLVVKYDEASGEWRDELARNWSNGIRFTLPDWDVFAIDATTLNPGASYASVGTILFNMAVNPVNGNLYVSNTEAQNLTRFEGPGGGGSTVQGNLAQTRVTLIAPGGAVKPRHINRHIDYGTLPAPAGVKSHSLATPMDMVVSSDGTKLYVAAFGSSRVGVFDTADLENDALWDLAGPEFDPTQESANYLSVSGGGPAGLALDEARDRLYVLTRFDNAVSVVDLGTGSELNHLPLHNPEPEQVVAGRPFLYDALATSSNGEASCSSCHIFGDFDSLAWDLGNPDEVVTNNPMVINFEGLIQFFPGGGPPDLNGTGELRDFHPMKGPMTTQTLRGLRNSGAMHWRGDRSTGFFGTNATDEAHSFNNFIVAFEGLVGRDAPISTADMQKFTDFALEVTLPPNPVRALDNSLTADQQIGRDFFFGDDGGPGTQFADGSSLVPDVTGFTCDGCHELDASQGFFGTGKDASFENEVQIFKIPHLRNMYQKVGMFGMPDVDFNNSFPGSKDHQGDQVRGTGFLHDGSTDTLFRFFQGTVFNNPGIVLGDNDVGFSGGDPQRRDMEEFMLAFDSDLAPIVGQQVTLGSASAADTQARVTLLIERAGASFVSEILGGSVRECDLVVKGSLGGELRGWLYDPVSQLFASDRSGEAPVDDTTLRGLAATAGQELTYTCAPPGSGTRMALDRDEDGQFDRDELDASTDPANAGSVVGACSDGIDNDGDGLIDFGPLGDPGCALLAWNIENPACNDGIDNDNDGLVDLADPHCTVPWKDSEAQGSCGLVGLEAWPVLILLYGFRRRGSAAPRGRREGARS